MNEANGTAEAKTAIDEIPQEYFFILFRVLLDRQGNPTRVSIQIDSDIKMTLKKEDFLSAMKKRSTPNLYRQIERYITCIGDFFLIDVSNDQVREMSRHEADVRLTSIEMQKLSKEENARQKIESNTIVTPALDKPFGKLDIKEPELFKNKPVIRNSRF